MGEVISAMDPTVILAGIRQFGLAADGSDLRDLEAAIASLRRERDAANREREKISKLNHRRAIMIEEMRPQLAAAQAREAALVRALERIASGHAAISDKEIAREALAGPAQGRESKRETVPAWVTELGPLYAGDPDPPGGEPTQVAGELPPGSCSLCGGFYSERCAHWPKCTPVRAEPTQAAAGGEDAKPHPRWKAGRSERHPQSEAEWNYRNDPAGGACERSIKRLNVAIDYDDPRAPDQMALVLRIDLSRLMGDWIHKNAAFKHFIESGAHAAALTRARDEGRAEGMAREARMLEALYTLRSAASNIDGDAYFDREPSKAALRQLADAIKTASQAIKLAEQSGDAWQPIESAPKDGTRILWCADNGEYARRRYTYSVVWWPEFRDCFDGGFWQPLPAPPRQGQPAPATEAYAGQPAPAGEGS